MTRYWRRMRRLLGLAGAVASFVALSAAPASADEPSGSISGLKRDADQVRFVFSADDLAAGTELDLDSLRVTLGGRAVDATVEPVASTATPVARTAVLAIDASGSMKGAGIAGARAAAEAFLRDVPADVRVGLVAFSDTARVLEAPTTDRSRVSSAVARLTADGDTSVYDAIALSLRTLGTTGERTLVVLSDGKDTSSRTALAQVEKSLAASGVTTRVVSLATKDSDPAALRRVAAAGHGSVLTASDSASLAEAFRSAARSFVTQVVVTAQLPSSVAAGRQDLEVEVGAGDVTLTAATPLTVTTGVSPASGQPQRGVTRVLGLTLAAFGVGLFLLLAVAFNPSVLRRQGERRSRQIARYSLDGRPVAVAEERSHGAVAQTALALADRAVKRRGLEERSALWLDRAELPFRPHEWLLLQASAAVGVAAGVVLLTHSLVAAVLAGPLTSWVATRVLVRVRAGRRMKAFQEALPDTLQLVASSLQTGFSLPQALDAAAREGDKVVGGELRRALAEARLGVPVEDALEKVADRMDSEDFRWVVMAIRIQREVGGNLAEVLTTTVKTMRDRAALHRHVRALSAEGRLSAYILIALPIGLATFMWLTRRDYLRPLWTEVPGLVMSTGGVVSLVVGWFWMRKLVRVEV